MQINECPPLDHLDRMTDSTGLIQHAIYSIPRRDSGYTTDDNARALRLCARLWGRRADQRMLNRVTGYLGFLEFAHRPGGGFHNFLSYQRHWLDVEGCGDCQGQAVLALAEVLGSGLPDDHRALARELIEAVLPTLAELRSLRAQAYVILAWGHLWRAGERDIVPLENVAWSAAQRLVECYHRLRRPEWQWFESRMTYANAVLPHALFVAAQRWPKEPFHEAAEAAFAFLDQATTGSKVVRPHLPDHRPIPPKFEECFAQTEPDPLSAEESSYWPVGNSGWYPHGGNKTLYDQQPVEASTMAEAALAGFNLLGEEKYLATFRRAYGWFHGQNSVSLALADVASGGCCDGLEPSGVNRNQGAESTLAYLWVELQNLELQHRLWDIRNAMAGSA